MQDSSEVRVALRRITKIINWSLLITTKCKVTCLINCISIIKHLAEIDITHWIGYGTLYGRTGTGPAQ